MLISQVYVYECVRVCMYAAVFVLVKGTSGKPVHRDPIMS